jgi:uncharacterized protein (DUF2236 family)
VRTTRPLLAEAEARELLVGPDSVCWRFVSDPRLYLGMLYPLLLQVAHPTVDAGVSEHSDFEQRPWQRLLRTLDYVSLLVYGGEQAIAAGRRLRDLHGQFRGVREDGTRYHALEPGAYAWVHATLLESVVSGHRHFGRPMRRDEVERFYDEYRGLGGLIGVRPRDLPDTWHGFRGYLEELSLSELSPTESVRRVLRAVALAPPPLVPIPGPVWTVLRMPARRALWLGGVGQMSPALRRRLEIEWGASDQRELTVLGRATRAMTPLMPHPLRVTGPAQLRLRRRAIADGPLAA